MHMENIQIYGRTMAMCREEEALRAAVAESVKGQKVIFEADSVPGTAPGFTEPAKLVLSGKRSFAAAEPYAKVGKKVCVLNFASYVCPGGGVTKGAGAQEESLCRISTLYPALKAESAAPFYRAHLATIYGGGPFSRKNTDDCIYTPGVRVICEDTVACEPLEKAERYTVDVITCAAPDQRDVAVGAYHPSEAELYRDMAKRIERIYAVAAANGAEVLILGAFGCGVFRNDPETVARAFEAVTEKYKYHFDTVEFAVAPGRYGDRTNYLAFRSVKGVTESR